MLTLNDYKRSPATSGWASARCRCSWARAARRSWPRRRSACRSSWWSPSSTAGACRWPARPWRRCSASSSSCCGVRGAAGGARAVVQRHRGALLGARHDGVRPRASVRRVSGLRRAMTIGAWAWCRPPSAPWCADDEHPQSRDGGGAGPAGGRAGALVALHFAVQFLLRPHFGHLSDGRRRTGWIVGASRCWRSRDRRVGLDAADRVRPHARAAGRDGGVPGHRRGGECRRHALLALVAELIAPAAAGPGRGDGVAHDDRRFIVTTVVASRLLEPFSLPALVRATALCRWPR